MPDKLPEEKANHSKITEVESNEDNTDFSYNLLQCSPCPTLVADADSAISYVNPAVESLTGYKASEILDVIIKYRTCSNYLTYSYHQTCHAYICNILDLTI